jgi:transposase-like protein/DNA-binding transcriptional regulator YhcF (GntR family)
LYRIEKVCIFAAEFTFKRLFMGRRKQALPEDRRLVSRSEAATILGVSPQTVSNYISKGILAGTRRGSYTYVFKKSIDKAYTESRDAIAAKEEFEQVQQHYEKKKKELTEMGREIMKDFNLMNKAYSIRSDFFEAICSMCGASDDIHKDNFTRRTASIIEMWLRGQDYSVIAKQHGLTKERVRQLIASGLHRMPKWKDFVETAQRCNALYKKLTEVTAENEILKEENQQLRDKLMMKESPKIVNPILSKPIHETDLSTRAVNCLYLADIKTVYDLTNITRERLMCLNQMGKKTVTEIEDFMTKNGLQLKL